MLGKILNSSFRNFWLLLLLMVYGNQLSAMPASEYVLGAGDKILINVYGEDDLTVETEISESGKVNYPFLGELKIDGLTVAQLEEMITSGLRGRYLVKPNVHVSIQEYRPFYIYGEVEAPGGYPYQPGLTVGKAAALAKGFTPRASKRKIYVVRAGDNGEKPHKVDVNAKLQPGDIVTVEESFF